jgi:hypothetical protein
MILVRDPEHPDSEEIEIRALRAELDDLYQKALEKLRQSDYEGALKDWETIRERKGNLDYADSMVVEGRAKEGLCGRLYTQALIALHQKEPHRALDLWEKIRAIKPDYPDRDGIEEQARELKPKTSKAEEASKRKRRVELRQVLAECFDKEDLRTLCFDLGVEYDDLPAMGRRNRARELVKYLEHRGRIQELIERIKQLRPDVLVSTDEDGS